MPPQPAPKSTSRTIGQDWVEHSDRQGQQAMNAALRLPLVRGFFAILTVGYAGCGVMSAVDHWERGPWYLFPAIGSLLICLWFVYQCGYVALRGRSRTDWYAAIVRRYRPSTGGESDA